MDNNNNNNNMFTQQFKIILWKNWKIFKQRSSLFFCAFEIFFTFLIIGSLSLSSNNYYFSGYYTETVKARNITGGLEDCVNPRNIPSIAFVLPKSNHLDVNGETFISYVMNDPDIKNEGLKFKIFDNEKSLEEFIYRDQYGRILCGVVFYDDYLNYSIRIKGKEIVDSNANPIMDISKNVESDYRAGYESVFLYIQVAIDNAIIQMKSNNTVNGLSLLVGEIPKSDYYYSSKNIRTFDGLAPFVMLLCIGQFLHISNRLMDEIKDRTKEGLISIGTNSFHLWFTWEVIYIPQSIFIMILYILFDPSKILHTINPIIFFVYYFFYVISMYNVAVILSLLIKKAKTVTILLCVFVVSMISVNKLIFDMKINGNEKIEKILSAIISPIGVSMGSEEILHQGKKEQYIGFSNLFENPFRFYFIFAFIDMIAYFLIAVIMDYLTKVDLKNIGIKMSQIKKENDINCYEKDIQEDPTNSECYVDVKNINKLFKLRRGIAKNGCKVFAANNDISFKVYKDEIFAILGHNGAGKSTLIQNMVGISKPDHGETYYSGLPFSQHKKEIRRQFGICLQNNILFNNFTVADHFKLYCGIKCIKDDDFERWIKEIDLIGKEHYDVQKLSGGQKRKLCIGLALIGNPKYVFLDEPTTGLDPLSRRKIWNLLLKIKKDRVIFITTHYMDEADIIADRKLILNKGKIRCLGSSVYLKNHFQMKYNLEVETENASSVECIIKQYIPEATYYHDKTNVNENLFSSGSTHIWKLPVTASCSISALLCCLEKERGHLLKNFSLNSPLLEELFVRLDRESEEKKKDLENQDKAIILPKIEKVTKPSTFETALRLCRYRIRIYLRQKSYWFLGILVPVAILIIFLPIFKNNFAKLNFSKGEEGGKYEKRELSSSLYKNQQWNYDIENTNPEVLNKITQNIIQQELPKHSDQGNSVDFYNIDQIVKKCYNITREPYYVSSFSGDIFNNNTYQFTIIYNETLVHSLPSTVNMLSNAILASYQINDTIHLNSFPFNHYDEKEVIDTKVYFVLILCLCITFPLSFYGTNVVRERVQQLLKQFQLNGIANRSYWLSVLMSDYIIFIITCAFILLTFVICKFSFFFHFWMLLVLIIFMFLCCFACLLYQYNISYIFNTKKKSFLLFFIFNIVPPTMITLKARLDFIETDTGGGLDVNLYWGAVVFALSTLFPNYGFIKVFRSLVNIGIKHRAIGIDISLFSILNIRHQIVSCIISSVFSIVVYSYLLIFLTKRKYNPKRKILESTEEINKEYDNEIKTADDDVQNEYYRIVKDEGKNNIPIKILKLSKEYDEIDFDSKQEIVDALNRKNAKYGEYHMSTMGSGRIVVTPFENVSFGINKCECFGILGPNGSGKTSLLNTTSFTFPQTIGKIYYDGKDTTERVGNEINLGYCSQEDTLWNVFTLYEHIEMFLYLRGYSKKNAKRIANEFIRYCRLTEHKNKMPHELSGGTRRKLSILIALCCSSTKIIMDEPTAGMDPSTRRYIWDIIKDTIQHNQSSAIMSTHSMEEAELLCNRIAIMIKGKLRCIGSPEHLKMKFGNTYILDVHSQDVEKFHQEVVVQGHLFDEKSSYSREDKSFHRVKYEVKNIENVSFVFERMESCLKNGIITDYSFSQTSLEQVFLNFSIDAINDE